MSESEDDDQVLYLNYYCHEDCPEPGSMTEWDDVWDCQCDDECPTCGTAISPYRSDEWTE